MKLKVVASAPNTAVGPQSSAANADAVASAVNNPQLRGAKTDHLSQQKSLAERRRDTTSCQNPTISMSPSTHECNVSRCSLLDPLERGFGARFLSRR